MYRITRFYFSTIRSRRTIKRGLTLAEAREHCSDPETSSVTCTNEAGRKRTRLYGAWFEGFEAEAKIPEDFSTAIRKRAESPTELI